MPLLAQGIDPARAKQQKKQEERAETEHTFVKLAEAFLAKGEAEGRAPATLSKNTWLLEIVKADFGHVPIKQVTAPMILESLRKVEAKGNYEIAQRLRSKVSVVFRFSVASGIAEADPAHALRDVR